MKKAMRVKLVDQANILNNQIAALTKQLEEIKQKFKNEGEGVYFGTEVALNVEVRNQLRFSQSKAKGHLTPEQLSDCFYPSESQVVTFINLD